MVASIIRTGFAQRDQDHVQFQEVTMTLKRPHALIAIAIARLGLGRPGQK